MVGVELDFKGALNPLVGQKLTQDHGRKLNGAPIATAGMNGSCGSLIKAHILVGGNIEIQDNTLHSDIIPALGQSAKGS